MNRDRRNVLLPAGGRVLAMTALLTAIGCTQLPKQRYSLEKLEFVGNENLDDDEIEEQLASSETPKFLGLFPGLIYDYEVFNRYVLEKDLERIVRFYRSRGYYEARARAARVFPHGSKVRVQIEVDEGEPVLLRRIDVHGLEGLPADLREEARASALAKLPLDMPFQEESFAQAGEALSRSLANHGYALVEVRRAANVNVPEHYAAAGYWVTPGPEAELGAIHIEGLSGLPEDEIRDAFALERGEPYSQEELDEAKRALLDLGVFSAVDVDPQLDRAKPGPNGKLQVPIHVKLEKAKLHSVHLGGGIQIDSVKSDFHLSLGWEDQSFLGGMRKLQLEAVPGAVIYPTRFPSFETPERLLPQGRIRGEFRQPGILRGRTNLLTRAQVSVTPALFAGERDPDAPILGSRDYRASLGLERTYYRLYGYVSHTVQVNTPFAYVGEQDPDLHRVIVSYPALFGTFDLRDDVLQPHRGLYLSAEAQVAGVGGDARDVKLQPELRVYVPLGRRFTLAVRGTLGMLFAFNYGDTIESDALTGSPGISGPNARADWIRDIQIMFLRGFFSGGSGSNRGYGPREIGPHGVVPFYNHGQSIESPDVDCSPGSSSYRAAVCDLPLGGFTLWEASLELRYPLAGLLSGAVFTDTSDVSPRRLSFRWNRPHLSVGLGLRYGTPVGAVRFDLGYRVPGLQAPESADEGTPTDMFGLPLAATFGIGESF